MSNHQHTLIIDGTSGISGDMTVAALLDLGASEEHLREQLATLPVDGFTIAVTRVNKHGIDACDCLTVNVDTGIVTRNVHVATLVVYDWHFMPALLPGFDETSC